MRSLADSVDKKRIKCYNMYMATERKERNDRTLSREVERLTRENRKLREQLDSVKGNNARHIFQLNVVTRSGILGISDTTTVRNTYYSKRKDALNDIKFEYYNISQQLVPDHEMPTELHYTHGDMSAHLKITEIEII